MTDRWEEGPGSGPGVAVVPWDRDPDNCPEASEGDRTGEGAVEEKLVRIEALLKAWNEGLEQRLNKVEEDFLRLLRTVPTTADFEGMKADREVGILGVREDLANIRYDLRELGPAATRQDVESVLNRLHTDFGWVREHLTFLRGVATVWSPVARPDPAPRSRAGVAMLCLLWVLTVTAAFGAGAVAFGGLRVDVAWEQGRAGAAALPSRHVDSAEERRLEGSRAAGLDLHPDFDPARGMEGRSFAPAYGAPAGQGESVRRGPAFVEAGTP